MLHWKQFLTLSFELNLLTKVVRTICRKENLYDIRSFHELSTKHKLGQVQRDPVFYKFTMVLCRSKTFFQTKLNHNDNLNLSATPFKVLYWQQKTVSHFCACSLSRGICKPFEKSGYSRSKCVFLF